MLSPYGILTRRTLPNWSSAITIQRSSDSSRFCKVTIPATMLRAVRTIHSSPLLHQPHRVGPILMDWGASCHRMSNMLPRVRKTTKGPSVAWGALRQMAASRPILVDSETDSDESKNPYATCPTFGKEKRYWTTLELRKPGMARKNCSVTSPSVLNDRSDSASSA